MCLNVNLSQHFVLVAINYLAISANVVSFGFYLEVTVL